MRALIENYRGWDIFFDTDKEEFYTISNEYDHDRIKRSYASAVKYIDDYIKANNVFKPVKVQKFGDMFSDDEVITLIGIRKDAAFMMENEDGVKQQFSSYSEDKFFLVDERNAFYIAKITKLREDFGVYKENIRKQVRELEEKLIKVSVKEYKKTLNNQ